VALSREALARWLAAETGAAAVTIERLALLGGGAIQENWALDIVCTAAVSTVGTSWCCARMRPRACR